MFRIFNIFTVPLLIALFLPYIGFTSDKMSVAVVEFDVKGDLGIKDAGAIIAEWMINAVDKTQEFDLKERVLLKKILEEQELGLTGLIDKKTASKIGEIYGVKGLITGSVIKWENIISVTARLIDTNNGTILKTAEVKTHNVHNIPDRMYELALIIAGRPFEIGEAARKEVPVDMVFVKEGCFQMGDIFGDGEPNEKPVHEVCLGDYYMDKYEVTQKAYKVVTEENPSKFVGDNLPVEQITWHEANEYCEKIGKRLPTEAEWEYAARSGGKGEKWAGISGVTSTPALGKVPVLGWMFKKQEKIEDTMLGEYAWYERNSSGKTHPVGQKKPNALGLHDMSGNVWEWVFDWYGKVKSFLWYDTDYYKKSLKYNPSGPESGTVRVLRGGSWFSSPKLVRTTFRRRDNPDSRYSGIGFRCAKTP